MRIAQEVQEGAEIVQPRMVGLVAQAERVERGRGRGRRRAQSPIEFLLRRRMIRRGQDATGRDQAVLQMHLRLEVEGGLERYDNRVCTEIVFQAPMRIARGDGRGAVARRVRFEIARVGGMGWMDRDEAHLQQHREGDVELHAERAGQDVRSVGQRSGCRRRSVDEPHGAAEECGDVDGAVRMEIVPIGHAALRAGASIAVPTEFRAGFLVAAAAREAGGVTLAGADIA
jgi:hypothetical protein